MSSQEFSGSFAGIFPSFSAPMKVERSRNKERLEASLAGLCELESLKQRQESRVLAALCLGDAPEPARRVWGALVADSGCQDPLKDDTSHVFDHQSPSSDLHCNTMTALEQQVSVLKVQSEPGVTSEQESSVNLALSSGEACRTPQDTLSDFQEEPALTSDSWLSNLTRWELPNDASNLEAYLCQETQQVTNVEAYITRLIKSRPRPARPFTNPTNLPHDVSAARQSHMCFKAEEEVSALCPGCSSFQKPKHKCSAKTETPANHIHAKQSIQDQQDIYSKPGNPFHSYPLDYTTSQALQNNEEDCNSEPDSTLRSHQYHPLKKDHQADEALVSAEYTPGQSCRASTRAYPHQHSTPQKVMGAAKHNRSILVERHYHHEQPLPKSQSQRASRAVQKKCRSEDKSSGSKRPGKKTYRSQSENSLQRVQERKHNTVEKECGGAAMGKGGRPCQSKSKKPPQANGSCRRWQSTLEFSQDEADPQQTPSPSSSASNQRDNCARQTRKSRPAHASYIHPVSDLHHRHVHHPQEYRLERNTVALCQQSGEYPQCDTESSMSEAESLDSSTLSSDTDESGGLVWPQQLPPRLSPPFPPAAASGNPLQPKAFVKIKASHALKKKIMRFRTGSLKVITTV